jgi:Mannosyltransferase (PIG-V)
VDRTERSTTARGADNVGRVRLRDGVGFSVAVFLGIRVLLSLLAVLTVGTVRPPSSAGSGVAVPATPGWHNAIDGTDRWDAGWFERIAQEGYDPNDASAAFFPGYPLVIRAVTTALPIGEGGAAILVSNAAFLGALIVLFALTTLEFSPPMAKRTVLLLAFFPASFFFLSPYSESLFLLASLLCFWYARRGQWGAAAAAGVVAAATRSVGVLLVPALLVEAWSLGRSDRRRAIVASLAPLAAPAVYALYWLAHSGDVLLPFHAQDAWSRTLAFPLITLGNGLWLGISGITDRRGVYWTADLVLTAAVLLALALRWRLIPKPYLIYVGTTLVLIFSYPLPARPLLSVPRFVAVLFPVFWAMSDIFTGRRLPIALTVSGIGFAIMAIAFMNWGFIF